MINRKALLDDLKKLVAKLEKDLRERCEENAEVDARVRIEYEKAKEAKRTAQAYTVWRDDWITQVAVAWVLGVVFVRFIEDNGLIAAPFIAGPGERLDFAKDQRMAFFQRNPTQSDREYLEHVFREVAKLPAMKELYDERHNPLWALGVSGDGAKLILEQFQKNDPATATLVHDFSDPEWNTRFLGDLYQDLSEAARKKYALLQTPEFVEEFILDRTLDPAIAEFGLETVRMIDPTCGSGHFLLGTFARLFRRWEDREPATSRTVLAQRALGAVYGVDLNPFAVAISRFRLLLMAMKASGGEGLKDAPAFEMNLATGDSLLHGPRFAATAGVQRHLDPNEDPLRHVYQTEDADALRRILFQQYHSVVGNPPYIAVRDKALNEAYRQKYGSCSGKYSLSVPFMERFFELALTRTSDHAAGFVGQITANSFMKRAFGAKLIESYLPRWDLTHVIDTSRAYIPGHGTPTVILFGRNQQPTRDTIRAVLGIRGCAGDADNPPLGHVWKDITTLVDQPGESSEWISISDASRSTYLKHPWSIGGGGAKELKEVLDSRGSRHLEDIAKAIGIAAVTGEDDLFLLGGEDVARRIGLEQSRTLAEGDEIRDWTLGEAEFAVWCYDEDFRVRRIEELPATYKFMWPYKCSISSRRRFGTPIIDRGMSWYEWQELYPEKLRSPFSIVFPEVATHNHFVLDRAGGVFKNSATVVKLADAATEREHLELLAFLNSSVACFWLKQVSYPKSHSTQKHHPDPARTAFAFSAGAVRALPVPDDLSSLFEPALQLDQLARTRAHLTGIGSLQAALNEGHLKHHLVSRWREADELRERMVALQEEIDWRVYHLVGIGGQPLCASSDVLEDLTCPRGDRPFEQLHGRRSLVRRGGHALEIAYSEVPPVGSVSHPELWSRRLDAIRGDEDLQQIEVAEFKRLWRDTDANTPEPQFRQEREQKQLRDLLLDLIEAEVRGCVRVSSSAEIAHGLASNDRFASIAELYRTARDFDVVALVRELIDGSSVPALSADRYRESGLRTRRTWEETWEQQRKSVSEQTVRDIQVPPKYKAADFSSQAVWAIRGKLDVPKERFMSFPECERESGPSMPILWAGLDHLQKARAIAAYYQDLKENEATAAAKLGKLLACILEVLPWLKQWHNEINPEYGTRMGDFFESFMHAEMAGLGLTMDDLRRIRGL